MMLYDGKVLISQKENDSKIWDDMLGENGVFKGKGTDGLSRFIMF